MVGGGGTSTSGMDIDPGEGRSRISAPATGSSPATPKPPPTRARLPHPTGMVEGGGGASTSAMDVDSSDAGEKGRVRTRSSPATPTPPPALWLPATPPTGLPVSPSSGRSWREALPPPPAVSVPDSELRKQFIQFLESYTRTGEGIPFYENQVRNLGRVGRLEIQFEHLLDSLRQDRKQKKFLNLVVRIGNESNDSWLAPAVQELMKRGGNLGEAYVSFVKKPRSISRLKDILTDKGNPPTRMVSVLTQPSPVSVHGATTRGRSAFRIPLLKLLALFSQDYWFEEDFDITDFLIIESDFCYILQYTFSLSQLQKLSPHISAVDASKKVAAAKARNLASLWKTMEEFFIKNGVLPIYFEALKHDMLTATPDLVKKPWFLKYLGIHFSLGSSMCRKLFSNESYQVCKTYSLDQDSSLKSILLTEPSSVDWRLEIALSNEYILKSCFWHGVDLDGEFKNIAEFIKLGEFDKIDQHQYTKARGNTVGAVLEYKRHLLQHLEEHFKKQMEIRKKEEAAKAKGQLKATIQTIKIKDFDDIEIFASGTLPEVEPPVLKHIMEKNMQDFGSLLSL